MDYPHSYLHPNSPNEKGLMIYMQSPDKQPDSAIKLCEALRKIGVDVPFVVRPGLGPAETTFFLWAKALIAHSPNKSWREPDGPSLSPILSTN